MKKVIILISVFWLSILSIFAVSRKEQDFRLYEASGIYPNLPYEVFESGLIPNEEVASKVGELYFRAVYKDDEDLNYFLPFNAKERDGLWFLESQEVGYAFDVKFYTIAIDKYTGEVKSIKSTWSYKEHVI